MKKKSSRNLEKQFKVLSDRRELGLNVLLTKLENMKKQHELSGRRGIIKRISHRMKTFDSAMEKCRRKECEKTEVTVSGAEENFTPTIEYIEENIFDLAGARIITRYIDDIEEVFNEIIADEDIEVKKIKNYVADPKENGYRSFHILANIKISNKKTLSESERVVPVEIQIRTSLMDAWASIEHKLVYKTSYDDVLPETIQSLSEMSSDMYQLDNKLLKTRKLEEARRK